MKRTAAGLAAVFAVVALLGAGCGKEGPSYVVKGNLALTYMIQTSPTEAGGSDGIGAGEYRNRELRFYQSYIVVLDEEGRHGWVVPMDRVRNFAWQKK
jgi:hypothetical protein